jgi:hypothetical protein
MIRRDLLVKSIVVAMICFASAAAFSAYLKPGMLVEFANLLLCI